jgi:pimeloyl-ACP methyl ester carboxylesterase
MINIVMAMPLVSANAGLSFTSDYGPELESLDIPVLITQGEQDRLVLPVAATELHDQIPNSTLSLYPGTGHAPFLEMPERFNLELAQFVEQAAA